MPFSSSSHVLDEALKKAMADFSVAVDLMAEAYRKFAATTAMVAAVMQPINVVDDDGMGTTGTIMSIHDGVPSSFELETLVGRLTGNSGLIALVAIHDDPMMLKYWVSLTFAIGSPMRTVQQGLSYLELQCWPAGTRSAFECLVARMVNTEFGLGLSSYTLFAGDVRKALLADIAERFGNLPLAICVSNTLITVADGEGYFFATNAPDRINLQSYEGLRDRVLMKLFTDMEEVEDDD